MAKARLRLVAPAPAPRRQSTEAALRRVHRRLAERERQIAADRAEELALRRRYAEERNMLVPRFETLRAQMMKESGR